MNKVNLLRVIDLSPEEREKMVEHGIGDLLRLPTSNILSSAMSKGRIDLNLEDRDVNKASVFEFKFISYKTPFELLHRMPKRFYF